MQSVVGSSAVNIVCWFCFGRVGPDIVDFGPLPGPTRFWDSDIGKGGVNSGPRDRDSRGNPIEPRCRGPGFTPSFQYGCYFAGGLRIVRIYPLFPVWLLFRRGFTYRPDSPPLSSMVAMSPGVYASPSRLFPRCLVVFLWASGTSFVR